MNTDQKDRNKNRGTYTQCLKITEKVSFNIASVASYVYILSRQKLIKNVQFSRLFEKLMLAVKNWWKMPKLKC